MEERIVVTDSNNQSIATWIQVGATLGVVAGLILVIMELQQTKALTRAQMGSQFFTEILADNRTMMGENPSESMTKACLHPDQLTEQDLVILASRFSLLSLQATRIRGIELIGDFGSPWEQVASNAYRILASTRPGRAWLVSLNLDPELQRLRSAVLENSDGTQCADRLEVLRKSVAAI